METAALELAAHPSDKLLAKYCDAPGARMVERLFKPATFSLETSPSPSPAAASRRKRLNMNVTPEDAQPHPPRNNSVPRSRPYEPWPHHAAGGRGRYNKNFRPVHRNATRFTPNEDSPTSSNRTNQSYRDMTPPSISGSSVSIRPWSPVKGRVLAWDDV